MDKRPRRRRAKQGTLGRQYESAIDRLPILLRAIGVEPGGGWKHYEKAKELIGSMREVRTPSAYDAAIKFLHRYLWL